MLGVASTAASGGESKISLLNKLIKVRFLMFLVMGMDTAESGHRDIAAAASSWLLVSYTLRP